jgi:hypothetical protein
MKQQSNAILSNKLFEKILLNPLLDKEANRLYIVSGYASASMASYHLEKLHKLNENVIISLIIGMTSYDGLSESNHRMFKQLMDDNYKDNFSCSYVVKNSLYIHSKVYTWCKEDEPICSFIGSANYTNSGFLVKSRQEAMTKCSPTDGLDYFNRFIDDAIYCNSYEIEDLINIHQDRQYRRTTKKDTTVKDINVATTQQKTDLESLSHVKISLISKRRGHQVPSRSGLNFL